MALCIQQDPLWEHLCACYQKHGTDQGFRENSQVAKWCYHCLAPSNLLRCDMAHFIALLPAGAAMMNLPDCLQEDPASHEPVSLLGFDPVLSMPSLDDFSKSIKQQKRSLKALLLDQVRWALQTQICCCTKPPLHALSLGLL